jgi:hypothetical protein
VPLHQLFSRRTGQLRFHTRTSLARYLRFSAKARLVITGVGDDRPLEAYWSVGRAARLCHALQQLSPDLLTSPNFSVFSDVPRWDNLQNMKRIALCWREFAQARIPTALHVNARTDRDWERWSEFLIAHPERLRAVIDRVARPLRLVVKGGLTFLPLLRCTGAEIVFVDSSAYMRTMKRRLLKCRSDGRVRWRKMITPPDLPLDELLQENVAAAERRVRSILSPEPKQLPLFVRQSA